MKEMSIKFSDFFYFFFIVDLVFKLVWAHYSKMFGITNVSIPWYRQHTFKGLLLMSLSTCRPPCFLTFPDNNAPLRGCITWAAQLVASS